MTQPRAHALGCLPKHINRLKQFRRVATRYDKTIRHFSPWPPLKYGCHTCQQDLERNDTTSPKPVESV